MTYARAEDTFTDADAKIELAETLLARAEPVTEDGPAWQYLVRHRRLPIDAVRAALPLLRHLPPPIPGRGPADHALVSLLQDSAGAVSGLQLTYCDISGAATAQEPRRQSFSLRANGCRDALFGPVGSGGDGVAHLAEGYGEKTIALASLGVGPCYGGGGRTVLGFAAPVEPEVILVSDRRPDGPDGDDHDRDYQRAADRLLGAGKDVSLTPDPPCSCCKDADAFLRKHGVVRMRDWIDQARPVELSLDGEARRLADIKDPLERDRATASAAKRLRVRVGVLREAVRRHHDGEADKPERAASGSALVFDRLEPAADRQNGARLFDDLDAALRRHVFMDQADRTKSVLWSVHNHRRHLGNVSVLPRVIITAADPDSGKSTLGVYLAQLGDTMEYTSDPSASSIFRTIETHSAGFLLDETDGWWHRDPALRTILNSGFTIEGASVMRTEETAQGGRTVREPRRYSTFAPIAAIGLKLDQLLPLSLLSRSLVITMRPALVGEVPEELLGNREAVARLRVLASRIKRWVADNERALSVATPAMPPGLVNRLKLVWRPLLLVADQAGGDWPRLAREALEVDRGRARDPSLAEQLLQDMRAILKGASDGRLHTVDILAQLTVLELRTWSSYGRARLPIRDIDIANLLRPYEVRSVQLKIGKLNRWGYRLADVEAAIDRYIPSQTPTPPESHYPTTEGPNPTETAAPSGSGDPATSDATTTSEENINAEVAATQEMDTTAFSEQNQRGSGVASEKGVGGNTHSAGPNGAAPEVSTLTCASCGSDFMKPARGRPPKRCPACRGLAAPELEPGVVWS